MTSILNEKQMAAIRGIEKPQLESEGTYDEPTMLSFRVAGHSFRHRNGHLDCRDPGLAQPLGRSSDPLSARVS